MATTTIYPIPGYPTVYLTTDGAQMTIRPDGPGGSGRPAGLFRSIPPEDRFYLKEDVTDPKTIARWAQTLDYSRVLPLLAFLDGTIVGDGTLHHRRAGARQHIGEVRVVVAPAYRSRGVGRGLLHKLIDIAGDKGLKQLCSKWSPIRSRRRGIPPRCLGFVPVAVLPAHVRDLCGTSHDLLIMERRLLDPGLSADGEVEDYVPVF